MNLRQQFLTQNPCFSTGDIIIPKGVMVHSTGANNPALNRYIAPDDGLLGPNVGGRHWNQDIIPQACVHAFIGKLQDGSVATYQTLPWNCRGWHAGGRANDSHLGFEICEDGLTDPVYFATVYQEAVEFTAHLCNLFGLNPLTDGVVICHSEGYQRGIATNHADVMHWFPRFGKTMDDFRKDVKNIMEQKPLEAWQIQAGTDAIDTLNAVHIVANPDDWKKTLDQPVPQWLFWVIMERIRVASIVKQGKE